MAYDALRERLRDVESPRLVAFPDGSVDTFCRVRAGGEGYVESRETFANDVADGAESFRLEPGGPETGGRAVNMATQAHSLGGRVTLYGHLDHPVFDDLPFDATSMGEPTDVSVLRFEDGSLMLATESDDVLDWTPADLRRATDPDLAAAFDVDGVCCGNWASFPALTDAFRAIAEREADGGVFVFDPGDLTGGADDAVEDCFDALSELDAAFDVIVSVNDDELDALARTFGVPERSAASRSAGVRDETGVTGVVLHGKERAVAATRDDTVTVENLTAPATGRTTGAGDRFSGALAFGLAAGWDAEASLALGNACASHYVQHAMTASPVDLREFVSEE